MLAALLCNLARVVETPAGGKKRSERERQERLEMLVELFDRRIPEPERVEVVAKVKKALPAIRRDVAELAPAKAAPFIAQVQALVAPPIPDFRANTSLIAEILYSLKLSILAEDEDDAITVLLLT